MKSVSLFVYGSLRRGRENHDELEGARYVGPARTEPRYRLVQQKGYRALVEGDRTIEGELYDVDEEVMDRLDAFEGTGYVRATVMLADGTSAFAYWSADGQG
jgi:gamma-glutamylaminecyclotransferase